MSIRSRFEGAKARYDSTDFAKTRARRQEDARLDYDAHTYSNRVLNKERPLNKLQTSAYEVLGKNKQKLFRDGMFRAADKIIHKVSHGNLGGDYTNYTDALGKRIDRAEATKDVMGRREKYRQYRSDRLENRINRLEDKRDAAKYDWQRRRYHNMIKESKRLKGVHDHFQARHQGNRVRKPEKLRTTLDRITKKRVDAMYRKVLREDHNKHLRNAAERQRFEATIKPKDKQKLIREAILRLRKENIAAGRLNASYTVDTNNKMRRPMGDLGKHYEYTHEYPA